MIKDLIKYMILNGKRIAVSANLITMLGLGNVACATVQQAQPEKSFSVHKEASDPEHEAEAEYNKKLIKRSKGRQGMVDFWYKQCLNNVIVMGRYGGDTQKLWKDIVDWLSGETNINPIWYTYEENKLIENYCQKQTGNKSYEITNNGKFRCLAGSKER